MMYIKTVILCGGSGTRLWPLSRTNYPKQFYPLIGQDSLYQLTIKRNASFSQSYLMVLNQEQYFMGLDQYNELKLNKEVQFVLEPMGKNTAPAIALAALASSPNDILLVLPSDHLIEGNEYEKSIKRAIELAEQNFLVTMGLMPSYPETGYGYIQAKGEDVLSFKEKPNLDLAKEYLQQGNYFWNSGMFCFKAGVYLDELKTHAPYLYNQVSEVFTKHLSKSPWRFSPELFKDIQGDSIDYAVMEKSQKVKMVAAHFPWNDLGSFASLYQALPKDTYGNSINDNHLNINSHDNLVVSPQKIVATIGLNSLIIVDTPDALLISRKEDAQKVKDLIPLLKEKNVELTLNHQTVFRPWGSYTILHEDNGYKVKKITVKPGQKLSLQKHHKRSEHWVVVRGKAKVTVGERVFYLQTNESTYIPAQEVHRLENDTNEDLFLIEAQVGPYLGEDDIVRLADDYKRN